MSDYYDSPNDRDDYYCYQGSDSWSINSGAETFREQRGEEVKLIAFRSPSENEEASTLVESLWSKVQAGHSKLDVGTCCHQLGRDGTRLLLAKIQHDGSRWTSFRASAQKKPKGDFKPFNPLYLILDTLLQLPNLKEVELSFHIDSRTIEPIRRLLSHPKLEAISISNRGFNADLVSTLLSHLNQVLPTSSIRHLSLSKSRTEED
ncbi:hypothetical protein BDY24DRAFT_436518, partial [Mrakia frigida]|uniref:uncharacterized protein n=1 Tax=Mrakia frigida TaxID=29902 RepID=UPI003FCC1808